MIMSIDSIPVLAQSQLAESFRLFNAHIEFTSNCNQRCVYCAVSQPGYKGRDMPSPLLDQAIASLGQMGLKRAICNGHGENTMIPGWHQLVGRLQQSGARCSIITNSSHLFSADELEVLLTFSEITISCDTADPQLFKAMRRGGDFRNILWNMNALQSLALQRGLTPPAVQWSCVLSDRNLFELHSFVSAGITAGVSGFQFCHLIPYPKPPGTELELLPPERFSPEQARRALDVLNHCEQLALRYHVAFQLQPEIRAVLTAALAA
jgi:MoaA/NifB/PqqE/SkfB family radical SAM enzyme